MERAIPCELPFFYFRSAQFNSSKNITFVPNLQEIFKVVKRTFLYINLVIALFFVLPVSQAKEKISQITEKLRKLRKEVKLCNGIAERSGILKSNLEQVLAEEEKTKGKENRRYEQRR